MHAQRRQDVVEGVLHAAAHLGHGGVLALLGALEDDFVVDLQQQLPAQLLDGSGRPAGRRSDRGLGSGLDRLDKGLGT